MGIGTAVGLLLSAAGTAASMKGASDSRRAMNDQVKRQLQQQDEFKQQATPFFEQSLDASGKDRTLGDVATGASAARGQYDAAARVPGSTSPLPFDAQQVGAINNVARSNAAQGQGYDEASLQRWLRNQKTGTNLGVISNLSQASAGTSPILTQLAGNKGAQLAGIGSLMSTAGNLASVYGGIYAKQNGGTGGRQYNVNKVEYK